MSKERIGNKLATVEPEQLAERERIFRNMVTRRQANKVIGVMNEVAGRKEAHANAAEWTIKLARRLAIAAAMGL